MTLIDAAAHLKGC